MSNNTVLKTKYLAFIYPIFFIMFLLLFSTNVYSWYLYNNDNEVFCTSCQSNKSQEVTDSFVVYPNYLKTEHPGQLVQNSLTNIPTALVLNADVSYRLLYNDSVKPDHSVDRLIAVNLKLKKLLDDYEKMKKNSKTLLGELKVPYLDDTENKTMKNNSEETSKINRRIESKISKTVSGNRYGNLGSPGKLIYSYKAEKNSYFKKSADKKERLSESFDYDIKPESFSRSVSYNKELPWFFKMMVDVFKFCIKNRYEVILFGAVFISFIVIAAVWKEK